MPRRTACVCSKQLLQQLHMGAEVPQFIYYLVRDPSDHLSPKVSPTPLPYNPTNMRTSIFLNSFGANCHLNHQTDVTMINLLTNDRQAILLSVLVVLRIATPLQNTVSASVTHLPHLQNLQLAHPLAAEQELEISLLVGEDHYWDIVGDHIVRG